MSTFRTSVSKLLSRLHSTPSVLEQKHHREMKHKLDAYCGKGQGLGNKCSDQESCFAVECEADGWSLRTPEAKDGLFYTYQVHGTQKSIDFQLIHLEDGIVSDYVNLDLKHGGEGAGASIFLNDGTFLDDVIYVISFTRLLEKVKGNRKCPRQHVCVISLGQNIMTAKDKSQLERRFALLRMMNDEAEDTDDLVLYVRNANQFKCRRFTSEFVIEQLAKTQSWLVPSVSPIEQEPHSQLA